MAKVNSKKGATARPQFGAESSLDDILAGVKTPLELLKSVPGGMALPGDVSPSVAAAPADAAKLDNEISRAPLDLGTEDALAAVSMPVERAPDLSTSVDVSGFLPSEADSSAAVIELDGFEPADEEFASSVASPIAAAERAASKRAALPDRPARAKLVPKQDAPKAVRQRNREAHYPHLVGMRMSDQAKERIYQIYLAECDIARETGGDMRKIKEMSLARDLMEDAVAARYHQLKKLGYIK
mgnify:CR=1 FL=1